MSSDESTPPDPARWWWHRRWQSYIGILGLLCIAMIAVLGNVDEAAAGLLEYTGIGCVLLIVGYGPGSTMCDAIKNWKGN